MIRDLLTVTAFAAGLLGLLMWFLSTVANAPL